VPTARKLTINKKVVSCFIPSFDQLDGLTWVKGGKEGGERTLERSKISVEKGGSDQELLNKDNSLYFLSNPQENGKVQYRRADHI
jgi:hypothetical protein